MTNPESNYNYDSYISNFSGATVRVLPTFPSISPSSHQHRDAATEAALSLIEDTIPTESVTENDLFDFFSQKNEIARDTANLIAANIQERFRLRNDNISQLYDDLLKIDNWRLERPFPENYFKDKLWMDFNKLELKIHEQIRREQQDTLRDTAFAKKDLRESVIDLKKLQQKQSIFAGGLEEAIEDNYQTTGDTNRKQP